VSEVSEQLKKFWTYLNMKKIYYILILSCFLLFSSQSKKHKPQSNRNIPVQDIKWKSQKDFEINDIVKDIQYILLENKKECVFSEITKLIIENNRIYILDFSGKSLLVFDINGKFLHKVGSIGGGPGEYARYINFDVHDNMVYVYDFSNHRILIYDEMGKYKENIKSSFNFFDLYILKQKKYLLSLSGENGENNKVALTTDLKKMETAYFSFSKDFKGNKLNVRAFHPFQGKIAYMHPVSDTLFIFDEQGNAENSYFFDFGDKKVPQQLKNDYSEMLKQEHDNNYIYILDVPIIIKQYIFAELVIGSQQYFSVFDIQKNELTYELRTPENFNIKNINFPLCAMDDAVLVSYIDFSMYEVTKDKDLLDDGTKEHLLNDGVALCLYKLK
jgi:hypothetical protein